MEGSVGFEKSDDPDLFYSLHNVDYEITKMGSGAFQSFFIEFTDVYDFELNTDYELDSLLTTLVNDWGWLSQKTGYLKEIDVSITIW